MSDPTARGRVVSRDVLVANCEPAEVVRGRIGLWRGATRGGDSGLEAIDGLVALSYLEVVGVTDGTARSGEPVALRELAFALGALGPEHGVALRLVHDPARPAGGRLRLMLVLRSLATSDAGARREHRTLRSAAFAALPGSHRYVDHGPGSDVLGASLAFVRSGVDLIKQELWVSSTFAPPHAPVSHYYAPHPWRVDAAAPRDPWPQLTNALLRHAVGAAVIDLTLVGGGAPTPFELDTVAAWVAGCSAWTREQRVTVPVGVMGRSAETVVPADPPAAACVAMWQATLKALAASRTSFVHGLRVMWDDDRAPLDFARLALEYLLAPTSRGEMVSWRKGDAVFERALNAARLCTVSPAVAAALWREPDAPETVRRLHRLATLDELGAAWSLPTALEGFVAEREEAEPAQVAVAISEMIRRQGHRRREVREGLGAAIGRSMAPGDDSLVELEFHDEAAHALVVGRSGSGKSSLYHALILALCARYSPQELELHLIDMKPAGVEFTPYRDLPHARFVALGGGAPVALAALRQLGVEMAARNERFAESGTSSLAAWSRVTREVLPRVLVIIDEFQQLFEGSPREADEASTLLREVARLGRSAGMHLVLATQSFSTAQLARYLDSAILGQCPVRVSLMLATPEEASKVLTRDPTAITKLRGRGEAVLEVSGQQRHVKIAYGADDEDFLTTRAALLRGFRERHPQAPGPRVFSDKVAPPLERALRSVTATSRKLPLCLGERLDAGLTTAVWALQRSQDAHLLVVGSDASVALDVAQAAALTLLTARPAGARALTLVNLAGGDDEDRAYTAFDALRRAGGTDVTVVEPGDYSKTLKALVDALPGRSESLEAAHVIWLFGVHGCDASRAPSKDDKGNLARLILEGPKRGVFLALWGTTLAAARESIDAANEKRYFSTRVLLGAPDIRAHIPESSDARMPRGQFAWLHMSRPDEIAYARIYGDLAECLTARQQDRA